MPRFYNYLIPFLLYIASVNIWANDFSYVKQQASKGNPVAQYTLGIMYQQAKTVKQNKTTALSWYQKSAKQNYLLAQYALIAIYQYGDGIKASPKDAVYWHKRTTEPRSLILLNEQQQSFNQITDFLLERAIKNNTEAQYLLATLYSGNKNEEIADYWFLRAAIAEDKNAQYYIGVTYTDKPGLINKTQGIYWLEKAALQNFLDAEIVLASIYEQDKAFTPDFKKAAYWYERAANQGDAKAQSYIAGMYRDGKGVTPDKEKAIQWYQKAAKQGDAFSQYNLGQLYEMGDGVKPDIKKALYWYGQGAKQGHVASQLKLQALQTNMPSI